MQKMPLPIPSHHFKKIDQVEISAMRRHKKLVLLLALTPLWALLLGMIYSSPATQDLTKVTVGGGDTAPTTSFAYNQGYKVYWGDLHGHSTYSNDWQGDGSHGSSYMCNRGSSSSYCDPEGYFRNAIMNDLHFAALTDHPESIYFSQWADTFSKAANINTTNFFPFVGMELCRIDSGNSICTNVIYSNLGAPSYPLYSHESMPVTGDATVIRENVYPTREDAWTILNNSSNYEVLGLHVIQNSFSTYLNWNYGAEEKKGFDCVEFASTGGRPWELDASRRTVDLAISALKTGLKMCATGTGNDHFSNPGRGPLTGVLAKEVDGQITREAIWEALKARRTFAVFGPGAGDGSGPGLEVTKSNYADGHYPGYAERIRFSFEATVNGQTHLMGESFSVPSSSAATVNFGVHVEKDNQKLRRVNVLKIMDGVLSEVNGCLSTNGSYNSVLHTCSDAIALGKTAVYFAVVYFRNEADTRDIDPSEAWSSPIWITIN